MSPTNDRKLLNIIRYAPVVFISIFAIVVNIVLVQNNRIESAEKMEFIRSNLIEQQKRMIQQQVDQVAHQIERQKSLTVNTLQTQIRNRVYEAYQITSNIYQSNLNRPKAEVTKMIVDALRPIRFNSGRGYFFIYDAKGVSVMNALVPQLEGNSLWNSRDARGSFIVQEHIARMNAQGGEAFYHWWYRKPGESVDDQFEKIGFGKYFEPFGWYIGTGDYIADVDNDIKQSVIDFLDHFRFGENDYIFAMDSQRRLVSHPAPDLIGQSMVKELADKTAEMLKQSKHSGFITYMSPYMPGEPGGGEKISYMKVIDDWNWVIGTGFYVERFQKYLDANMQALEETNKEELQLVVIASLLTTLLIIGLSLKVGNAIGARFNRFQEHMTKDFKELQHTRDKLKYLAEHDALTDLPNRLVLTGIIHSGIDFAQKNKKCGAVMLLDLDDFKKINDLHGHSSGDRLLKTISRKFETLLGAHDTVSRFGGDEFIFCFPDLNSEADARSKADAIRSVFLDKFVIDGKVLTTNCSIGVSMFPIDDNEPEALIRKADVVLYKSKALKKGGVMFYNCEINEEVQLDYMIEEELRAALKENEISVFYQPQIKVSDGQMAGVEALARWTNQHLGMISPAKFIPIAEDIGLIREIGLFVFRQACSDILAISPNGSNAIGVSINISPKQLTEPDFPQSIVEITHDVGIDIKRITLEITENVLLEDLLVIADRLSEMKGYGFGISLDDFGTGYSSLSYLNNLPITEIKIDRSFVEKLLESKQTTTLVKSIIAIGDAYNMSVVAEGVESQEQYAALEVYGCEIVQGYYFSAPLPVDVLHNKYCRKIPRQGNCES